MKVNKSEEEWKKILTPSQYKILREKGTEPAFSGKYVDTHVDGDFNCRACGSLLFNSNKKFDSKSGWSSFYDVADMENINLEPEDNDPSRIEVQCGNCGSHLGHVFKDGPKDKTGLRYCINSASLNFKPSSNAFGFKEQK